MTTRYKTIKGCKQVQTFFSKLFSIKILLAYILSKMKLDSLVHLTLECLLGYMMIDHIALMTMRKVNFLPFPQIMTV